MGFKFRKSIKMGPVRVNLSKSGVSTSVGVKGARVSLSPKGKARATVGIPGTGISYSKSIGQKKSSTTKKASTRSSSQARNTSNSYTSSSSSSAGNGGCLKGFLWFLAICLVIGLISKYWGILLVLALVVAAAYIAYRIYRKKNSSAITEATTATEILTAPNTQIDVVSETSFAVEQQGGTAHKDTQSVEDQHTAGAAQFEAELNAITKVEIILSAPAERQLLKNLPAYSFSNITRTTRLDSIFPLVVLDVETTGLYPSKAEIVEVSAIKFDTGMKPVSCFTSLCKPKKPIPEEATAVNNITDDMVKDSPSFAEIAPALTEFMQGCHVAGHNLDFDLRFIFAHGATLPEGKRFYDTLDLARLTIPQGYLYNYKLDTLCNYYKIRRNGAHRSLSDCYATSKIFSGIVLEKTDRQLVADTDNEPESGT